MPLALRQIFVLLAKDLRIEARSRHTLGLVLVLGLLIVVVLALGMDPQQAKSAATSTLWVAYLFGGVLCFEKTMAVESQDGALAALLMAPVDRGVIYLAKLLANLALMLALAAVVTPVAVALFGFDLSAAPGGFAIVMSLSMLGFASVGTLFAAAVSSSRLRGGLLALIVFPVSLPLVIASTQVLNQIFREQKPLTGDGLAVIIAFDALYLVASWLVFELVLEP